MEPKEEPSNTAPTRLPRSAQLAITYQSGSGLMAVGIAARGARDLDTNLYRKSLAPSFHDATVSGVGEPVAKPWGRSMMYKVVHKIIRNSYPCGSWEDAESAITHFNHEHSKFLKKKYTAQPVGSASLRYILIEQKEHERSNIVQ
jgi:hypothetical protein